MSRRRRNEPPPPPPTRDAQVARQHEIIARAQSTLALLVQLPEWAIVRTAARDWRCFACEQWIARRELHVEDRREIDERYFIKTSGARLCLKCAPRSLAVVVRRIVRVGDEGGES